MVDDVLQDSNMEILTLDRLTVRALLRKYNGDTVSVWQMLLPIRLIVELRQRDELIK